MLYIVLILVLAALVLLVTALITANSLWAWVSIGLSVIAGVLLVADWLRRRARNRAEAEAAARDAEAEPEDEPDEDELDDGFDEDLESTLAGRTEPEPGTTAAIPAGAAVESDSERTVLLPAAGVLRSAESEDLDGEPGEEQTDAADLLIVSELPDDVLVVDEYPRYHLTQCSWLSDRDTIPIAVSEARELGFTPCARCRPDAKLAASRRNVRRSGR